PGRQGAARVAASFPKGCRARLHRCTRPGRGRSGDRPLPDLPPGHQPQAHAGYGFGSSPMIYITRERVHVDRIATAWAIRKFIDAEATFQFVPRTRDVRGMDGIPFDVRGAALTHRGGRCTFEVLLETYDLDDPALQ